MAFIQLYREKLQHNYRFLDTTFREHGIDWAIVTKLLCGTGAYLEEVLKLGITEVCDARVSNLKKIRELAPHVQTVYIKPPARRSIPAIVKYADASFNTEYETICWLSEEAVRQKKEHKVIIMIELGDLREGVMGSHLVDFYEQVFRLPNIRVTGLGTNLNCLHGVYPSEDKLIQLSLYKQLIETRFSREIPWLTGGTSVTLPLLFRKQVPAGINHFRIGETLFFGNNLVTNEPVPGMENDIFKLFAEIIEIAEKPKVPIGYMGTNVSDEIYEAHEEDYGKTVRRAIVDLGVLDVSSTDLIIPEDDNIHVMGASSDMLVLDIGESSHDYQVGDLVCFRLRYMGALRLLNSNYIEKKVT